MSLIGLLDLATRSVHRADTIEVLQVQIASKEARAKARPPRRDRRILSRAGSNGGRQFSGAIAPDVRDGAIHRVSCPSAR
jgi:hypothetical protein